jgi:hypothetical protein
MTHFHNNNNNNIYNEPIEDSSNVSQAHQDGDSIDSSNESDNASYGPETQETNTNNIGFDNGFNFDAERPHDQTAGEHRDLPRSMTKAIQKIVDEAKKWPRKSREQRATNWIALLITINRCSEIKGIPYKELLFGILHHSKAYLGPLDSSKFVNGATLIESALPALIAHKGPQVRHRNRASRPNPTAR